MTSLRVHHVGLWVADLEGMRQFYVEALGGKSGPRYANPQTGFRSYFVAFGDCRLELMWQEGPGRREPKGEGLGYAHVAMSAGGRDEVDARIAALRAGGARVLGEPRVTGDGYYEAIIADPEGNPIEIVE